MRKTLQDLAKAVGWWLWFVLGIILTNEGQMEWNSLVWVGGLSLLTVANHFFILSRYMDPKNQGQPSMVATLVAFLAGIFFGVAFNHGVLQAVGAVLFVAVATAVFWVVGFMIILVIADLEE